MPVVNGCHLPDDLFYDVRNQLWYRELPDGSVEVGITAVASAMVGHIIAVTPKRPGRRLEAGQACAVVEAGKLIGAAKIAFAAEILASNEDLLDRPGPINTDPHGAGWLVRVKPEDWPSAKAALTPGPEVAEPYLRKMREEDFPGCEGPS
ncbi:MAG: glycine cleavage system protein H [Proteobacteria bacterium]|nr:glycine cleavage system protein H [Pseudomonadota bacterium]MBI3499956.1 glycine cleavage system protein H [Pseudomonadota bacterium]